MSRSRHLLRPLSILTMALVAVIVMAAVSVSGPGFLTKREAKKLFYTKKQTNTRYYTKKQADARFADAAVRDELVLGVPVGAPLRSITIDDLPNLKSLIGGNADPATLASRGVILQGSASVVDEGVIVGVLLVWVGDASIIDGKLTWPVKIFRSSTDTEYTRPDLGSTELMHLVIVSNVNG